MNIPQDISACVRTIATTTTVPRTTGTTPRRPLLCPPKEVPGRTQDATRMQMCQSSQTRT